VHRHSVDVGFAIYNLRAADLDADGKLDLLAPVDGGVKLLRNRSTAGTFAFDVVPAGAQLLGDAELPYGVTAADLNRDRHMDLAVVDHASGELLVFLGTAVPFEFTAMAPIAVGGGPIDVVAADFNADGYLDLAISRQAQSDIAILRNNGSAEFTPNVNLPVGSAPNYLITADFNRDGRADLVVSNGAASSISVLFSRGNNFVSSSYPAGASPTALLARDLTSDGIPDILVASLVGADFRVLAGDGRGGFPSLFTFPGTVGATGAVLQDMDKDELPELILSTEVTTRVTLVRNISRR
jgi:hypothetical protein